MEFIRHSGFEFGGLLDMARILVVDDEPIVLDGCEATLTKTGYDVDTALSAEEALMRIKTGRYNVIVTDLKLPGLSGMQLLKTVKDKDPETDTIMITGYATVQTAVEAMRLGAFDYISKPFTPDELRSIVGRAIERRRLLGEERLKATKNRVAFEYNMPADLYYLPEHSWVRRMTENTVDIGIDDVFQKTIGIVTDIELPSAGTIIEQGNAYAELYGIAGRLYKLWAPVSGQVVAVNEKLKKDSSLLNNEPYGEGWIARVESTELDKDIANLLSGDAMIQWWLRREIVERKTDRYVQVSALDPDFKHEIAKEPGGENIKVCFGCGICTATCPIREIDTRYNPRKIIRMAILGMRERVLKSDFIWLCSTCYACTERCPQDVKFTNIINAIKNIAVKEGYIHHAFTAQVDLLAKHGRLYEIDEFDNRRREKIGLPELWTGKGSAEKIFKTSGLVDILKREAE